MDRVVNYYWNITKIKHIMYLCLRATLNSFAGHELPTPAIVYSVGTYNTMVVVLNYNDICSLHRPIAGMTWRSDEKENMRN